MALQGKITTTPSLQAKSSAQRTIDAQKVLLTTGPEFIAANRC